MDSLTTELLDAVFDPDYAVSALLDLAGFIAGDLGLDEFEAWISHEVNGYETECSVPNYRLVSGDVVAHNPALGLVPLLIDDEELMHVLSARAIAQPIKEIEALINEGADGVIQVAFHPDVEAFLLECQSDPFTPSLSVSVSEVANILNGVRTQLSEWLDAIRDAEQSQQTANIIDIINEPGDAEETPAPAQAQATVRFL